MLSLRIAWRFLKESPVQSLFIIAGIAVGIGVQVFVGSLITSLQADLVDQVVGRSAHLTVTPGEEGGSVVLDRELRETLERDDRFTAVVPARALSVLVRRDPETVPLRLKGAAPDALDEVYRIEDALTDGEYSLGEREVLVGVDFAEEYAVGVGDDIDVVQPEGGLDKLTISGIFDLGNAQVNAQVGFTGAEYPAAVLELGDDEYTAIELQVEDVFASSTVAEELRSGLDGDLAVTDWQDENADLLQALQSQSASSYLIQVFVVIAVALGIASTLAISAIQKTRQIGILKALGMSDGSTGVVFLWQGAMLGVAGTAAGIGLALGLIAVFQQVEGDGTQLFPIEPQPAFIAVSAAIGIGVAMASAIVPSRRTAKLDPIEVIQNG